MLKTIFAIAIMLLIFASFALAQDPGMPDSVIVGNLDGSPMYICGNSVDVPVWIKCDDNIDSYIAYAGIERGFGHFGGIQYYPPVISWDIRFDSLGIELPDYPEYLFLNAVGYCYSDPGFCPNSINTDSMWVQIMALHAFFQIDSLVPGDTSCMIAMWHSVSSVQAGCFIVCSQQGIDNNTAPHTFETLQIYPNPFNSQTTIEYSLKEPSPVTIQIYDLTGRRIDILIDEMQGAGEHQISWDASGQSSGIYFCRIIVNGYAETQRLILLK
jgi:hypothetical protein